ncbi:MAG: glycosyltransferase family 87 protein [Blastocatellia bacterium]
MPAGLGWDFANFYDTGRRAAAWQISDLYKPESLIAGEQPQGKLSFWSAPISAFLYAPLSLFSAEWALIFFKIQNALACFAALWLLYRNNRRFDESETTDNWRFAALFAVLVLIYQPFWTIYRVGGQTTPTIFLLFTIALLFHTGEKFRISAVCIALALLIKPAFVFMLLPLCLISGWRFIRELLVIFTVIGLFSIFLLGWNVHAEFLQTMMQGLTNAYSWQYNSSLYVTAENLRLLAAEPVNPQIIGILTAAVKLAVVFLFGWLFWKSRNEKWPTAARRQFDFLMSVTFCLMISQTVWEHYLIVFFPLLAYIAANYRSFSTGARVVLAVVFGMSLGQNIVFINMLEARISLNTIPELVFIGLLKSSPLWLMLIFLLNYRKEFFQSFLHPQWTGLTERS